MTPLQEKFAKPLDAILIDAKNKGHEFKSVRAGDLHRIVGDYPGPKHKMPICCTVMKMRMGPKDKIISQPNRGMGASLTIQYWLTE